MEDEARWHYAYDHTKQELEEIMKAEFNGPSEFCKAMGPRLTNLTQIEISCPLDKLREEYSFHRVTKGSRMVGLFHTDGQNVRTRFVLHADVTLATWPEKDVPVIALEPRKYSLRELSKRSTIQEPVENESVLLTESTVLKAIQYTNFMYCTQDKPVYLHWVKVRLDAGFVTVRLELTLLQTQEIFPVRVVPVGYDDDERNAYTRSARPEEVQAVRACLRSVFSHYKRHGLSDGNRLPSLEKCEEAASEHIAKAFDGYSRNPLESRVNMKQVQMSLGHPPKGNRAILTLLKEAFVWYEKVRLLRTKLKTMNLRCSLCDDSLTKGSAEELDGPNTCCFKDNPVGWRTKIRRLLGEDAKTTLRAKSGGIVHRSAVPVAAISIFVLSLIGLVLYLTLRQKDVPFEDALGVVAFIVTGGLFGIPLSVHKLLHREWPLVDALRLNRTVATYDRALNVFGSEQELVDAILDSKIADDVLTPHRSSSITKVPRGEISLKYAPELTVLARHFKFGINGDGELVLVGQGWTRKVHMDNVYERGAPTTFLHEGSASVIEVPSKYVDRHLRLGHTVATSPASGV